MNEKCIYHLNLFANFQNLYNANMYFRLSQENRNFYFLDNRWLLLCDCNTFWFLVYCLPKKEAEFFKCDSKGTVAVVAAVVYLVTVSPLQDVATSDEQVLFRD
jgi:hypothetical protein